jgi:glyoxylase-like metal-dependent hydrolase (beta-lactamase superfamily II)
MKVHHLNAATMCPRGARLIHGHGGLLERARLVCHVLLAETRDGLALVDTGLGQGDIDDPQRLGARWLRRNAPRLDPAETALAQVKALGYSPRDVRHILLTHLDVDHAGGVPDFPEATVHVHLREHQYAMAQAGKLARYIGAHWRHGPRWRFCGEGGEDWFGFKGVRALGECEPELLLIPLHGHTPGHCGVAVRSDEGWLLHAGDSYFFHGEVQTPQRLPPPALGYFQRKFDTDREARIANRERLRALNVAHGREVRVFCAHDPVEYDGVAA